MKCVKIAVNDDGTVLVGECPPEEAGGPYMQPAESVEAALGQAMQLLQGQPAPEQEAAQMQAGYSGVRGGNGPPGGIGGM